jgi:hypothetical protein
MKTTRIASIAMAALLALTLVHASADARSRYRYWGNRNAASAVQAGTTINVRVDQNIATDDVRRGDAWSGTVSSPVYSGGRVVIPAGSPVSGIVTSSVEGTHSSPAQLALSVRQVSVNGRSVGLNADTQPIVAGSKRASKLGAIALGAGAGALIGHGVAKDSHGTLIGGLLGGATAYGVTRHSMRTLQVKAGTELAFTANENVAVDY